MITKIKAYARKSPGHLALSDGDWSLTYGSLVEQVDLLSGMLKDHNLGKGHSILYFDKNMPSYLLVLLACMQTGIAMVPASPKAPKVWRDRISSEIGINALVEGVNDIKSGNLTLINTKKNKETAAIFTTSGTTGTPKGVPVCMSAVQASAENTIKAFDLDETSIFINYAPPFTVGGMLFIGLPMLASGCTNYFLSFSPFNFALQIEKYRPTHTFLLPAMISMLRVSKNWETLDLSCLRYVGSGASPVSESMAEDILLRGAKNFSHMYGSTECLSPVMRHLSRLSSGKRIVFSEMCGDYQMKLAEDGELWLKGSAVTRGYISNSFENEQNFMDGWFKTGDLFEYDGPALRFIGRKKNVLKVMGFSVYPVLTENVVMDFQGVLSCCVAMRLKARGLEELIAVVQGKNIDPQKIIDHCNENLSPQQVPRKIVFVDTIPLNVMKKVDRAAVQNLIREI